MGRTSCTSVFLLALLLSVATGTAAVKQPIHTQVAVESLIANQLTFEPQVEFTRAYLAIEGPEGFRIGKEFASDGAIFMPLVTNEGAQLPDGLYHYRLSFTFGEGEKSLEEIQAQGPNNLSGVFFVKGGTAVSRREQRAALAAHRNELHAATVGDSRPGPAPQATNVDDNLTINDTAGDGFTSMFIYTNDTTFGSWDLVNNDGLFSITPFLHGGESVYLNANGIGIGTSSPDGNLDISDTIPVLNIETDDQAERWQLYINPYTDEFRIRDRVNFAHVVSLKRGAPSDSIFVAADGKVGLSTETPGAPLEIAPASGNAAFRLNFSGGETWTISNTGSIVTFNMIGSGGQEATFNRRFDAGGGPTFDVQGSVRGTQFISSSSRDVKTNFAELDGQEVLSKLAVMPINSWSYKHDQSASRQFGPVAEDFQATFGLGDGKTISTVDAQGVTMAAIQGLNEKLEAKEAEIELLKRANAALEERLAALEQKIE